MRQALGLGTRPSGPSQAAATSGPAPASHDSNRQRRRFAQDGDVPVVMLHRGREGDSAGENKLAALSAEVREERAARLKAERALEEANGLNMALKTKLKHTEMTLEEKLRSESDARAQAETLLATEREARQVAESKAAEAALALSVLERRIDTAVKPAPAPAPVSPPSMQSPPAEPPPVRLAPDLFGDVNADDAPPAAPKRRMSKKAAARQAALEPTAAAQTAAAQTAAPAPETADDEDDKPIEWWLPSFRAARKTPARRKRSAP
jgi:hypothetical protein